MIDLLKILNSLLVSVYLINSIVAIYIAHYFFKAKGRDVIRHILWWLFSSIALYQAGLFVATAFYQVKIDHVSPWIVFALWFACLLPFEFALIRMGYYIRKGK